MSQASYNVPTGGSESATTFAGQCNSAWNALASKNSGAGAPANGPNGAATQFQDWFDSSSASFPVWRVFDGTLFDRIGTIDVANSVWCPQMGGGLSSISSAATTNIGSRPGTLVTITGSTTITSFGTSAQPGEEKKVYCGGSFTVTNSANIVCPGGTNIITTTGDIFTAIYDGAGVWLIYGYQKTSAGAGTNLVTGAMFFMYATGALAGAARCNGNTIGNTGSNATEGTGAAYQALYTLIWNQGLNDTEIALFTSGGAPSSRGANAAADFAALKAITLPDYRGRVPVGLDGMGNSVGAAGRLTSTTMAPDGVTLGSVGGAQVVTLTTSTMPAHAHPGTTSTDAGHVHAFLAPQNNVQPMSNSPAGASAPDGSSKQSTNTSSGTASITTTVASQGGGNPHLNVQPSKAGTWYIAL